jgi:hypothetical protein
MRASELIGSPVFDEAGQAAGVIRDLLVEVGASGEQSFAIAGLVLSERGPLFAAAHAWGFAQDRASGPALLRKVFAPLVERSRFVAADRVTEWGPDRVTISGGRESLVRLMRQGNG